MGTAWEKLRTLDLYDNQLTGEIPESLAQLAWIEQLQLESNDLDGEVPQSLLKCPLLHTVMVQENPRLHGTLTVPDNVMFMYADTQVEVNVG